MPAGGRHCYAKKGFHEEQRPSMSVNPSNSNASIFIYKSVTTLEDGYTSLNKAGGKRKAKLETCNSQPFLSGIRSILKYSCACACSCSCPFTRGKGQPTTTQRNGKRRPKAIKPESPRHHIRVYGCIGRNRARACDCALRHTIQKDLTHYTPYIPHRNKSISEKEDLAVKAWPV